MSLRIASLWSTNGTQDGAPRGLGNKGVEVECRGLIVPQVGRRAVPERRGQGFVDGRFELKDRRSALARFVRIISATGRYDAASVRPSGSAILA
jgi:hypothetical protein